MRKGFTLVELLAVIVVLIIILAIAVPTIASLIENARKNAFQNDVKMIIKAIDLEKIKNESFDVTTVDRDSVKTILGLANENYKSVTVTIESNITNIVVVGENKWEGLIAYGTYRHITVVRYEDYGKDLIAPIITLNGASVVSVSLGDEYIDLGATAMDDVDGDLTSEIITTNNVDTNTLGTYTITYTVSDSSLNYAVVIRTVNVVDATVPVITLLGSGSVSIEVGSGYSDAGATAFDDIDGDITEHIIVVSTVNPNVAGTYTVIYNVSDSAGNAALTIVRTVNVTSPPTLVSKFSYEAAGTGYPNGAYYYRNGAYYFLGDTPYNWIEFGQVSSTDPTPLMWRILKHNNDGIKIIYEGVKNGASTPIGDGRILIDGSYSVAFDTTNNNKWDRPATLKTKLEQWYNNLYAVNKSNLVQPAQWCIGPVNFPGTNTMYQALGYETSLTEFLNGQCTTNGSYSGLTSGTSPIGMINPSDFMSASSAFCMSPSPTCCNASHQTQCSYIINAYGGWIFNNYLLKGSYWYWTLNPIYPNTTSNVWVVLYTYGIQEHINASTNSGYGSVRPVINLKTTVLYSSGNGTLANPYTIK